MLDGEIVCPGADGRPVFNQLGYRTAAASPCSNALDLLWLNGRDSPMTPADETRMPAPPWYNPFVPWDHSSVG